MQQSQRLAPSSRRWCSIETELHSTLFVFSLGEMYRTMLLISRRGLPYMMSTIIWDFFYPSHHCTQNVCTPGFGCMVHGFVLIKLTIYGWHGSQYVCHAAEVRTGGFCLCLLLEHSSQLLITQLLEHSSQLLIGPAHSAHLLRILRQDVVYQLLH